MKMLHHVSVIALSSSTQVHSLGRFKLSQKNKLFAQHLEPVRFPFFLSHLSKNGRTYFHDSRVLPSSYYLSLDRGRMMHRKRKELQGK